MDQQYNNWKEGYRDFDAKRQLDRKDASDQLSMFANLFTVQHAEADARREQDQKDAAVQREQGQKDAAAHVLALSDLLAAQCAAAGALRVQDLKDASARREQEQKDASARREQEQKDASARREQEQNVMAAHVLGLSDLLATQHAAACAQQAQLQKDALAQLEQVQKNATAQLSEEKMGSVAQFKAIHKVLNEASVVAASNSKRIQELINVGKWRNDALEEDMNSDMLKFLIEYHHVTKDDIYEIPKEIRRVQSLKGFFDDGYEWDGVFWIPLRQVLVLVEAKSHGQMEYISKMIPRMTRTQLFIDLCSSLDVIAKLEASSDYAGYAPGRRMKVQDICLTWARFKSAMKVQGIIGGLGFSGAMAKVANEKGLICFVSAGNHFEARVPEGV